MNSRPFTWDDVPALHDLVRARWAVDDPREQMRIGDFYWTLRSAEGDPTRHMHAWRRDDGSLDAVAWLDTPVNSDIIVAPDAREAAFDEALDWLEREHATAGSGALSIVVLERDAARAERLAARGYARGDDGNVRLWREITVPAARAKLPDGFTVRGVSSDEDAARRAYIESTVWGGLIAADAWRSMTRRLPQYRADLDVIAVAADGAGASACTCWYDAETRCGELEAVGTSPAYRRMGLAKAVIVEGSQRLYRLGAARAVVQTLISNTPAIALYQSCGFEIIGKDYGWVKPNLRP